MRPAWTDYAPDPRSRPRLPDFDTMPSRARPTMRRRTPVIVGEFCPPTECRHPVPARVWPVLSGYVAACHDCGLHVTRGGHWEAAR